MAMKARALVIAEDNAVRRSLSSVLESDHHLVLSARDDEEGIDLYSSHWIDIVILDLESEAGRRFGTAKALKETNPFVPLIALTSTAGMNARTHHMDALLSKPVNIEELLRTTRMFLTETSEARLDRICGNDESCRYFAGYHAPLFASLERSQPSQA